MIHFMIPLWPAAAQPLSWDSARLRRRAVAVSPAAPATSSVGRRLALRPGDSRPSAEQGELWKGN